MNESYPISVLLPLRLDWLPVYYSAVPLSRGQVVRLLFCKKEYYAVVWGAAESGTDTQMLPNAPALPYGNQQQAVKESKIQFILDADTGIPAVSVQELKLWEFIASYYLCSLGEVYKAARPKQSWKSEQIAVSRLERLKAKLSKTTLALERKHRSDISERLLKEKKVLTDQINILSLPQRTVSPSVALVKPEALIGGNLAPQYIAAIRQALEEGGQILLLSPEIAFCSRLEDLLRQEFGELMQVVNSHKSAAQRYETAQMLRRGESAIVLGTRSSVFLPFSNLSLVIVDNEQEASYKQSDPAPRYNARDVAVWLASQFHARVLLGSPSPSLETLLNISNGKYTAEKIGVEPNCNWRVIDVGAEKRKNGMVGALSRKAIEEIRAWQGQLSLIRGWEKLEAIETLCRTLFPNRQIEIASLRSFKAQKSEGDRLVVLLQADAYLSKDDFRSDERAVQLLHSLSGLCTKLIVQTAVLSRFDGSRGNDVLLEERRLFAFPPYTRLINVHSRANGSIIAQHFIPRDASLAQKKEQIAAQLTKDCYADVDPV